MREELKQTIEIVASHPKTTVGAYALFTSNIWLDYGEPVLKALTLILGTLALFLLVVKHILDIKKELSKKD